MSYTAALLAMFFVGAAEAKTTSYDFKDPEICAMKVFEARNGLIYNFNEQKIKFDIQFDRKGHFFAFTKDSTHHYFCKDGKITYIDKAM